MWASNCGVVLTPQRFKGVDAILYMIDSMREISQRKCFDECSRIVVEFPAAFYSAKFSGGSMTPVAAISGACMVLFQNNTSDRIVPLYPAVWNGGKKKVSSTKIIQELIGSTSEWEYDDLPRKESDYEHIIDAVGMSYYLMKRDYFEREENV